jgi:hypothetical protein
MAGHTKDWGSKHRRGVQGSRAAGLYVQVRALRIAVVPTLPEIYQRLDRRCCHKLTATALLTRQSCCLQNRCWLRVRNIHPPYALEMGLMAYYGEQLIVFAFLQQF